ncbi:MAG TPA: hypothetical protein VJX67_20670 [Blastocatellia bacterium]|nr:hypothetical protein [Blastocatellia bacterium]
MVKRATLTLLIPILIVLVPPGRLNVSGQAASPTITLAYLSGKKLIVKGLDFQAGAVVLINGRQEPTIQDPNNPGTELIIRKGRRKVSGLSHVGVQVLNPDGTISTEFNMDRFHTVTLADNGTTVNLNMGDHLFVYLGTTYDWSVPTFDPNVMGPVPGVGTLIIGAQALLQTENPGQTTLTLTGDPPCRKVTPPCELPSIRFQITVTVQ